jgi:hypothetical protein
MLPAPSKAEVRAGVTTTRTIIENLVSGRTAGPDKVEETEVLAAMLDAFTSRTGERRSTALRAADAIEAAGIRHAAMLRSGHPNPDGGEGAEPPVTDLLPMLEAMSRPKRDPARDPGMPNAPIDSDLMDMLMAIERKGWGSVQAARRSALAALAERDRARELRREAPRPVSMSAADLLARIERLSDRLTA